MPAIATTKMLKLDQVAERLAVSKAIVEVWVYKKDLASFKKGLKRSSVRRVSEEALTKFVLLHTLNPRRPEWLTAELESKFQKQLWEMMQTVVNEQVQALRAELLNEGIAA